MYKIKIATINDLDKINQLYKDLINDMHNRDVTIWNDYYPFFMFNEDIKLKRMYLVEENNEILSCFVLAKENNGEKSIEWSIDCNKAYYLDRFAVNVNHLKKGIGTKTLQIAENIAKEKGANYLRLFVVPCNIPAIKLYEKCNYIKRNGLYILEEDENIKMYGYEKKI